MTILKIGNVELQNNLILAPMAGVTDLPYRKICKEHGCGLVCTEMVSAKAILYGNKNTIKLLEIDEDEKPVSLQLFGANPDIIAEMAAKVSEENIDIIDLNMGCPVPKVVNNGEGSALMKNPKLVEEILTKLVKASKKPVTVKFRKGFDDNLVNAVEIAKIAEASGVAAVAVHGRTREQYYSGKADWNIIKQVKENIKIPVIGNGDVFTPEAAKDLIEFTGCDGIMVARGAQGNPWIFSRTIKYLETGILMPEPTLQEIYQTMITHAKMLVKYKGEYTGVREMRKHASWYTKGLYNMAKFRKEINETENLDQLLELFRKNFE
jgi:nifR3 family TIM-barrel protein